MPFLKEHRCTIGFGSLDVRLDGKTVLCTDRYGHPLAGRVQVLRQSEIPSGEEVMVCCHVTGISAGTLGVVEGSWERTPVGRWPVYIGREKQSMGLGV